MSTEHWVDVAGPTIEHLTSSTLDYYLGLGIAVDQLQRALIAKPKIEIRIKNGLISVYENDFLGVVAQRGCAYVEITVDDWRAVAAGL